MFVRYSQSDHANTGNAPIFAVDNIADPGYSLQTRHNKSVTIGDSHVFSSRIVNEVRLSVSRQYLLSEPAGYNIDAPAPARAAANHSQHALPALRYRE